VLSNFDIATERYAAVFTIHQNALNKDSMMPVGIASIKRTCGNLVDVSRLEGFALLETLQVESKRGALRCSDRS